jgi:hypothetical protein
VLPVTDPIRFSWASPVLPVTEQSGRISSLLTHY